MATRVKSQLRFEWAIAALPLLFVAEQPRQPKGSPQGGQFAPKEGVDFSSIKGFNEVEIESIGKFKETPEDVKAEGGVFGEGSVEVNCYTAHTDQADRDEGISDQYFFDMGRDTYKAITENPDILKAAIAVHAENINTKFEAAFLKIPETEYLLYSDPQTTEFSGIYTKKEYDAFS